MQATATWRNGSLNQASSSSPSYGVLSRIFHGKDILLLGTLISNLNDTLVEENKLKDLENELESAEIEELLRTIIVVVHVKLAYVQFKPASTTLLKFIKEEVIRPNVEAPSQRHVLAQGYQRAPKYSEDSVIMKEVNTTLNTFKTAYWNRLFEMLGESFFGFLFNQCSLFIPCSTNNNYIQISGIAVFSERGNYTSSDPPEHPSRNKEYYNSCLASHHDHLLRSSAWKKRQCNCQTIEEIVRHDHHEVEHHDHREIASQQESLSTRKKPRLSSWRRKRAKIDAKLTLKTAESALEVDNSAHTTISMPSEDGIISSKLTGSPNNLPHQDHNFRIIQRHRLFYARSGAVSFGFPKEWTGHLFQADAEGGSNLAAWIFEVPQSKLPKRILGSVYLFTSLIKKLHQTSLYLILQRTCPISQNLLTTVNVPSWTESSSESIGSIHTQAPSSVSCQQINDSSLIVGKSRSTHQASLEANLNISQAFCSSVPHFMSSGLQGDNLIPNPAKQYSEREPSLPSSPLTQENTVMSDNPGIYFYHEGDIENELLVELQENIPNAASSVPSNNLMSCYCTHNQVAAFAIETVRSVIPRTMLGSYDNWKLLEAKVDHFVRMLRHDTISSKHIVEGFKISHMPWLHGNNRPQTQYSSNKDMLDRTNFFHSFICWLFDFFLIPLLRCTFYITESCVHQNQVFFYRREVWSRIHTECFQALVDRGIMSPISETTAKDIISKRELGYSFVRFVPKKSGARPIVNLRRKHCNPQRPDIKSSINSLLRPIHEVLKYETTIHSPKLMSSSIIRNEEIHERLLSFKKAVTALKCSSPDDTVSPQIPPLYFVKVDITSAYDEINQQKLLEIIHDEILSLESYLAVWWSRTIVDREVIRSFTFRKINDPTTLVSNFPELLKENMSTLKNSIITDQAHAQIIERSVLLALLKEHVSQHIIKHDDSYYIQSKGIPQGSCISALLCSLYFAHLERTHLSHLQSNALMLRWIDDFLYITPNKHQAIEFFNLMHQGFEDYGAHCNPTKSQLNFDVVFQDRPISNVSSQEYTQRNFLGGNVDAAIDEITWCGWSIHTRTLEVKRAISPDLNVSLMITNHHTSRPGETIKYKLHTSLQLRLHAILFDVNLNSLETIVSNLFDVMALSAMRLIALDQASFFPASVTGPARGWNTPFLADLLWSLVAQLKATLSKRPTISGVALSVAISASEITLISLKAFEQVFLKKQTRYQSLLKLLRSILAKLIKDHHSLSSFERNCAHIVEHRMLRFKAAIY